MWGFFILLLYEFNVYMQMYGYDRPSTPILYFPNNVQSTDPFLFTISLLCRRPRSFTGIGLWATCSPILYLIFRVTCYQVIPPLLGLLFHPPPPLLLGSPPPLSLNILVAAVPLARFLIDWQPILSWVVFELFFKESPFLPPCPTFGVQMVHRLLCLFTPPTLCCFSYPYSLQEYSCCSVPYLKLEKSRGVSLCCLS